ncbi:hypothetical protein PRZ48_010481 [Zasmidium cellare]|uniref:J domain-containing protein n=1 Tax=Zasmidium cellare TaxID=395010 RepID=A0ABR0E8S0_ZASCE|nr:hypothetical protein PRZ48_010481 [Zasmidium cellare]
MAQAPGIPDYYAILDTKPGATGLQIQKSYRKLLRTWRRPGLKAVGVVAMAAIDEAHETLKNVEKKRAYDAEYPSIRKAWKKYQQRKTISAQADDEDMSDESSDLEGDDGDDETRDDEDEKPDDEDEKPDDEDDTDDGGPDGEAVDDNYTDTDDEIILAKPPRKSVVVHDSEDEEPEAEYTDGEEPESDDGGVDEEVDLYIDYCTGYRMDAESESESESEGETRYAIQLRSGRWVDLHKHNDQDPEHETCELDSD